MQRREWEACLPVIARRAASGAVGIALLAWWASPLVGQSTTFVQASRVQCADALAMCAPIPVRGVVTLRQPLVIDTVDAGSKDHRWEGAAIGAVIGALGFGYLGARVCTDDCGGKVLGTAIGGAVLGGFVGLLLGGAIPKADEPSRGD